jgi:hypothetical protein
VAVRTQRVTDTEIRFREINEELAAGLQTVPLEAEPLAFVCECGLVECRQPVDLRTDEYEAVRRNSRHFVVVPGHELPDFERVIERTERYHVVEKPQELDELLRATDPRQR